MAFCINCGKEIASDAKFCPECGTPAGTYRQSSPQREYTYDGKVYKCPSCGEILSSFTVTCPSCGYEIRGRKAVSSVKELAQKLEAIEAGRERKRSRSFKDRIYGEEITKTDEQKISLIRSYPIPNTKEDLYEFVILAGSNIDTDLYDGTVQKTDARLAVSDAWKAKLEQAYQKARIVFAGDSKLAEIQEIYDSTHKSIKKQKGKTWRQLGYIWAGILAAFIFLIIFANVQSSQDKKEEDAQLTAIVEDISNAIAAGEYKHALRIADSIDYQGYNDETEREWELQREYWIDKIIDEAAQNGVFLERPTIPPATEVEVTVRQPTEQEPLETSSTYSYNEQTVDNTRPPDRFDGVTYSVMDVKDFSFSIPDYWSEEGSKNEYLQYYAEKGNRVVMLSIAYPEEPDDGYDVTFDGLYADNDNMIEAVESMFTDGDVVDYEVIESDYGVKGILYHFTYTQKINWLKSVDGSGYYFCFPSEDDRRWFYVVMMYTNNVASDDYKDDYMDLIATIKEKS